MSLLHRALQKASALKTVSAGGAEAVVKEGGKRGLLIAGFLSLLICLVAGGVYWKYIRKVAAPVVAIQGAENIKLTPQQEAAKAAAPVANLIKGSKYDDAKAALEKALTFEPDNYQYLNTLCYVRMRLDEIQQAILDCQRAVDLKKDCVECYNNLGLAYIEGDDLAKSVESFRQAIVLKPNYANTYFNLGLAYEFQGNFNESRKSYTRYLELAKGLDSVFVLKIQRRISALGN